MRKSRHAIRSRGQEATDLMRHFDELLRGLIDLADHESLVQVAVQAAVESTYIDIDDVAIL